MATNVPPVVFTPTGPDVPQESAVLAGVKQDINDAFGGQLNMDAPETPQGQLAASQAAVVADCNERWAWLVNQIDPDTAEGFMQDAIARIYFLDRSPGAPTAVQCVCSGAAGVVIPVGAEAQDTSGNRYVCTQEGTIPISGSITLSFANVVDGPTPCPADTLTIIYRAIPGWDSINNPTPGVPGRFVETRAEFEFRRRNSVALHARGSLPSIYSAVFDVADVLDVFAYENVTNAPLEVGSTAYELVPHSLYVAVVGGDAQEIAEAIWRKKDVGCDYNGNTEVIVKDTSGYQAPQPQYTVKFERPASLPIFFRVELQESTSLPADIEQLVRAAIIGAFNGLDGGQRARIGSLVTASRFVGPVQAIGPEVIILSILIGTSGPGALNSVLVGIDQAPTVDENDITVVITP
jgi:hypothetical protein